MKTEIQNLIVDSLLLGLFVALIEYSQWITFSAVAGTLINNSINKGWRGLPVTAVALAIGNVIGIALCGLNFSPDTNVYATVFCMLCITSYVLAIGHLGFSRNLQLRSSREKLQLREQELISVNDNLQKNLQEIDALRKQLQDQANRDPLTGLYNRRYLDATLDRELHRCQREGQPLALIMCDIDHFKNINDTYGHQAGDAILRQFSLLLGTMVRACDVACRFGGEEFLLLLPTMRLITAQQRAEKLRELFADTVVEFGEFRLHATISVGVAVYPGQGTTARELINSADQALYDAKAAGRNCVIVCKQD